MDPVLIVGAGIVGLTLGQALQKVNIPFRIYERDTSPDARGQGWAITLHWALEYIQQILPDDTLHTIQAVQVDPQVAQHDNGNFLFIDLATGEPKFKIPPSARWRVNREKMRAALLRAVDVEVTSASAPPCLVLADGTRVSGRFVIGVEGSRSLVRRVLRPDACSNSVLPIRFTGVAVDLSPQEIQPLRSMDPLLFQGCHPSTGVFFWFSLLETPQGNGTQGRPHEHFRAQICMSWPVNSEADEVAATDAERLENMKRRSVGFVPFLRSVVEGIPPATPVLEIQLADWECLDWDNRDGRVTLAGDAAHAMTMCRGEAANHGLLDAFHLFQALRQMYTGAKGAKEALDEYEAEMRSRTRRAVRLSRQACHDAHAWERLNEHSAILTKRAVTGEA
ncbi:FAD/NAD(P)-binding domain-containing protein [Aspergillus sclerotioniger CBS 115572]|uniref:FAD/NAD(P)-binding domain-containing protein n=1 Tax=Aspergillus sclerotioniger CBS 115572 TaxID=1450535 RepID=A0A317W8H5_9EURO|nr:FAD/NAD(P)-binding domain-containing protein [Aspergillus sclerotioniger CBS 115572]PWY81542.1 FAD/NAD(P)-binding domain-containing protein [Aspergillus sclerotioniger CBS 115572]